MAKMYSCLFIFKIQRSVKMLVYNKESIEEVFLLGRM